MNTFSLDYLSSNLNHIYSLIKEKLSTVVLNDQQKKIALIATGIIASLVASYALYRCCWRKKQVVPVNQPLQDKKASSSVATSSTSNSKKSKKKNLRKVRKTVATVAANHVGVTDTVRNEDQAKPKTAVSDAPSVSANPALSTPVKGKKDVDEEEMIPISPEFVERKGVVPQIKTTPNRTMIFPNWKELERNADGSSVSSTGVLQVTFEDGGGRRSLRFNGTMKEANGTVANLRYDEGDEGLKKDYTLDHPTHGLYEGILENEVFTGTRTCKDRAVHTGIFHKSETGEYLLNDPNGKIVFAPAKETVNGTKAEIREEQIGCFVGGRLNGPGKRTRTTIALVDNLPQGKPTVMEISGTFINSSLHGPNGVVTDSNGNIWKGTFEHNQLHDVNGEKFVAKIGATFKGCFIRHKFTEGKKILTNGDVLQGQFVNDKLTDPNGRKILANGDVLQGNFVNDELTDPNGRKILANGDIIEGKFAGDRLVGPGKKTLINGDVFEGLFSKDQLNGPGKKTVKENGDTVVLKGTFALGKLYGPVTIIRKKPDGEEIIANKMYQNDEPIEDPAPVLVRFTSSGPREPKESKVNDTLIPFQATLQSQTSTATAPIVFGPPSKK